MANGYYPQISLAIIDENGYRRILPDEDINVYNVTAGAALADLTSDEEGVIAEGFYSGVTVGDVIELSHDTYSKIARLTLQATQAAAYTAVENDLTTFIVENFFATDEAADTLDVYARDKNEPTDVLSYLGSVKKSATGQLPFQTSIAKTMTLYRVSKGQEFVRTENAFLEDNGTDVFVPATGSSVHGFTDHISGYTTLSTSTEDAYIDLLPSASLDNDGDKLVISAHGFTANNANNKRVLFDFNGTSLITGNTNAADAQWELNVTMMRVANEAITYGCEFTITGESPTIQVGQIIGLDLDVEDYDMRLQLRSTDAAGDVSVRMAHSVFYPAAEVEPIYLLSPSGAFLVNPTDGFLRA